MSAIERMLEQIDELQFDLAEAERAVSVALATVDQANDLLATLSDGAASVHEVTDARVDLSHARQVLGATTERRDDLRRRLDELRRDLRIDEDPPAPSDSPLDVGANLALPISVTEVATIEVVLLELWRAVDAERLTDGQQRQIMAMAEMIEAQRRATEPAVSEREGLVTTVKAALVYLRRDFPAEAIQWSAVIALLTNANWSGLADLLTRMAP
jgi:hypothetical protein